MKQLQQGKAEQVFRLAPPPYRSIDDLQNATLLDATAVDANRQDLGQALVGCGHLPK